MDEKIAKLKAATNEAQEQVKIHQAALDLAEQQLAAAKAKYKALSQEEQEQLQINDTELPELIEAQWNAKTMLETVQQRYDTNKRYLDLYLFRAQTQ